MTREELCRLIYDTYGVREDYPFEDDAVTAVFRHGSGRWFALLMNISESRLGREGGERVDVLNLKSAPEVIDSLVGTEAGIYRAYHMNKTHWLSALLAECDTDTVLWLLDGSFELTRPKLKKRKKGDTDEQN